MKKNPKVLIIDDNERICKMFQTVLLGEGIDVEYVLNGQDAIRKIKDVEYDCVFQDVIMPGMNGVEVIQKIRSFNKTVKIVLITGYFMSADILEEIKNYDVHSLLKKPITISQIVSIVKNDNDKVTEEIV